jgi:hypothetical protein
VASRRIGFFLGERLYEAPFSCDIDRVGVSKDKLSEAEAALSELGRDEEEISAVLRRFEGAKSADLATIDGELEALSEGSATISAAPDPSATETGDPRVSDEAWDENTDIEVLDAAEDFVLLVDEGDLEEIESAGEEASRVSVPPPLPGQSQAPDDEDDEEDEGFFKKLFGSRRSSNRP